MENPSSIRRLLVRTACAFLVVILLAYPLSIGPALFYMGTHHLRGDFRTFNKIYAPVFSIVTYISPLSPPLHAYMDFWEGLARDRS